MDAHDTPAPDPAIAALLARLRGSPFRARFRMDARDRRYLETRGLETIMAHGADFIRDRLAPAHPPKDGRQTPMRGHPIFVAQHATGSCCRSCLAKWQGIGPGQALGQAEQARILAVLREWIIRDAALPAPAARD